MRLRHAPRPFRVAVWPAFLAVGLVFAADAPAGSRPSRQPPDQAATLARLHVSADRFVAQWRYAWEVSETYRHGTVVPLGGKSSVWDPPTGALPLRLSSEDSIAAALQWSASLPVGSPPRLIETLRTRLIACPAMTPSAVFDTVRLSDRSGRSLGTWTLCPSWIAGNGAPAWDERLDLDTAILAQFRPAIRAARAALLGALDSAGAAFPGSDWIVGQRVRFSLDQRDSARAVAAIESCSADAWWCLGLAGYVLSLQHQVPRADAVFSEMLTRMLPADRCAWSDLSEIIGADGQSAYARVSCDARDSLNARIWWLSDPLYVEIGNERRVEHYARKVLVALRSATGVNERWDMGAAGGGGAVAEMLVRYGWPTQSWWAGRPTDEARFNALGIVSRRAGDASDSLRAHGRFATAEYTEPRYHTVPAWRAIAHPDTAHEADWELTDQSNQASMATAQTWWPREDYDRAAGPMVQLFTQEGEFRRQNGVLLAIGFDLDPDDFPGASHDTLDGALVFTTGPDSMNASHTFGVVGFGNQISALVPSRSQVVSLELFGTHPAGVAARTRFGLNPPPSLAALKPGEIAIATPVLVRPPADDEAPPTTAEAALARLQGPVISDWTHVGFYWETYGLGGSDTVEITMRFEPTHDVALSQLGIRPLPGAPASGTVDFSWREPDPGHFVMGSSATGTVPIQGRNVTLDLSSLEPGEYRLTVGATKLHGPTVTASRPFWVVRDGVAGPSRSMIAGVGAQPVSGASPAPRAPDPGARYLASASRNRIDVRDTVVDIDVSGLPGAGPGGSGGNGGGVVLRLSYVDSTKGEIRLEGELSGAGRVQPISQVVPTARLKRITILASGGNGAGGVSGRPGQRGTPGRAGAGGCPVGSDGTDGGDGGSGTSGGAGGNGGHAGGIAVTTAPGQDELLALVTQTARPGYGGGGGAGGAGGAGGPGGPGGGGCRDGTGSAGSSGAPGSRGSDGLPGPPGNPGA